jgi:hypothetical protein
VRAVRPLAALLLTFPAAAAPLPPGSSHLQLRIEGLFGQPTTQLGVRGGARAAPGGGITSLAFGLQATLDATPIAPYLELAMVDLTNRSAVGYSLATRFGVGADWMFSRGAGIGVVFRTYTAIDPEKDTSTLSGLEGAFRLVLTPGAL